MIRIPRLGLRAKLIAAFILVLLPVLGLLLAGLQANQNRREQGILTSQLQTANAIGNQVDQSFDDAATFGRVVAEDPLMQTMNPSVLDPYLQTLVRRTGSFSNISVYDRNGVNQGWGDPTQPATPRLTVDDMPYYRPYFEQTLATNRYTVSEVMLLPRPTAVGFIISVPIRDRQGSPIGVVALTERADLLAAHYAGLTLLPGETILLTDPTGRLAFTTAEPDLPYDQSDDYATLAPVQQAIGGQPAQTTNFVDPLQGDQRIGSFVPTKKYHWIVGVTLPSDTALADVRRSSVAQFVGFGVIVLLSIGLGVVLARWLLAPVRQLEAAAHALGRGDLTYRVRIRTGDELQALGESFNQMASQLETQRDEVMTLLQREEAIARIAQALVREVELANVVDVVIHQSIAVLHVDAAAVWLADATNQRLTLLAQHNFSPATIAEFKHVPYDSSVAMAVAARTETPQIEENLADNNSSPEVRLVYRREKLRSLLALPLCARGRLVGVVLYATRSPHRFTERELEFNSTVAGLFAVAIENARLYEQVQQALRLREDFIAAAAHELRTPITVIRGRSELTLRKDAREEPARSTLETVVKQTDRIARLADDLLTVVRLRPGFTALHRERLDLSSLVREVVARMAREEPSYHFIVDVREPLEVDADRRLIGEAFGDLLENAVRYSSNHGNIEVRVHREAGAAVVTITDHGVGILGERQPFVFEPFYEPVPSGEPGYIGLISLGLYLSKQIIQANGGTIEVRSAPGQGSTFWFTLPLAKPAPAEAARAPGE